MERRLRNLFKSLALTLMMMMSFLTGVFATQMGWIPAVQPATAAGIQTDLPVFWEAWNLIRNRFIDRETLDLTQLSYAAIQAVVEALGDTGHTRFLTPEQARQHQNAIDGHFIGIGAQLGHDYTGRPIIVRPYEGSPAQQAGLRAGDIMLTVDGEDVSAMRIEEIVGLIQGPVGTDVTLTVIRRGGDEAEQVVITRQEIDVPVVTWAFVPNSRLVHLSLTQFSTQTAVELERALTEIQAQRATGLIVDVRENPGGLLSQAVAVSSQFLTEGSVMQETDVRGELRKFAVKAGGLAPEIPLVVLVDRASASSAEIFAGAIQDNGRGLVVGETTFGTGTVLTPFTLSDGSILLLGTSEWLTPNGRSIRHQGIIPDLPVELSEDGIILAPLETGRLTEEELFHINDRPLLEAIKVLSNCHKMRNCQNLTPPKVVVTN